MSQIPVNGTAQRVLQAAELAAQRQARYAGRKRVNQIALTLSLAAMAFGVKVLLPVSNSMLYDFDAKVSVV